MDRTTFLLEREAIQNRMEARRLQAASAIEERQKGFIPRMLKTGSEVLLGFSAQGESVGWISSLLWAALAPVVINAVQRGSGSLVQKLVHNFFPAHSRRSTDQLTENL